MKTATITWVTYNNYGTVLQAYALQRELLELGHENEIIDDGEVVDEQTRRNRAGQKKPTAQRIVPKQNESCIRRALHAILNPKKMERVLSARYNRTKYEFPFYASQEAVSEFKKRALITRKVSIDSLESLSEQYDAFIVGSDQVWSLREHAFNPYFFLDFVTGRKVAYAPCLGMDQIPDSMEQILKRLLSDFCALSVREKESAVQLAELTGREVSWVVDPTILRGREGWLKDIEYVENPVKSRYLLCYFLESNPWYFEQVKIVAKKLRLRPVLIPSRWDHVSSEYVIRERIGPLEFVSLFQNADFVLTDSYHGSIFSLIFEKDFQYLERFREWDPSSQNIRIHSLFDALGINEMIVLQGQNAIHNPKINWPEVRERLEVLRRDSELYLISSLS